MGSTSKPSASSSLTCSSLCASHLQQADTVHADMRCLGDNLGAVQTAIACVIMPPLLAGVICILSLASPLIGVYLWAFLLAVQLVMMTLYPALIAPLFNKYVLSSLWAATCITCKSVRYCILIHAHMHTVHVNNPACIGSLALPAHTPCSQSDPLAHVRSPPPGSLPARFRGCNNSV